MTAWFYSQFADAMASPIDSWRREHNTPLSFSVLSNTFQRLLSNAACICMFFCNGLGINLEIGLLDQSRN